MRSNSENSTFEWAEFKHVILTHPIYFPLEFNDKITPHLSLVHYHPSNLQFLYEKRGKLVIPRSLSYIYKFLHDSVHIRTHPCTYPYTNSSLNLSGKLLYPIDCIFSPSISTGLIEFLLFPYWMNDRKKMPPWSFRELYFRRLSSPVKAL